MPTLGDDLPLVLRRRAQQPEERELRSLHREEEVVTSVDHQRGLPRVRFKFSFAMAAYNLIRMPKLLAAA